MAEPREFSSRRREGRTAVIESDWLDAMPRKIAEDLRRAHAALTRRARDQGILYRFTDKLYRAETLEAVFDAALEAITGALSCDRASILLCDEAGVMRFVASRGLSAGYQKAVTGHSPWKAGARGVEPIWVSDIERSGESDEIKTTVLSENIRALAFIPLCGADGVIGKFMAYHPKAHTFNAEEIGLAVNIARQLGFSIEQHRAAAARREAARKLEESEERFRAIVETTPECVRLMDRNGIFLMMNTPGLNLLGASSADQVIGRCAYDYVAQEDREAFRIFNESICDGARGCLQFDVIAMNGRRRKLEAHAAPFRDPSGSVVSLSVTRDVTERIRAEEQRTLLINELNHRVKNTLATVQSLASQTLRSTQNAAEAQAALEARVLALARAHDVLTCENWRSADLETVVREALMPFRADQERFELDGEPLRLAPGQALAISMALHELATNAAKYGALSNEAGRVRVAWSVDAEKGEFAIDWTESGGPKVTAPVRRGFGSRLIERNLGAELGAEAAIEFRPEGVRARLASPLAEAGCARLA